VGPPPAAGNLAPRARTETPHNPGAASSTAAPRAGLARRRRWHHGCNPRCVVELNDTKRRMNMIRNALFGISLLALSGSAIAAPAVKTHATKARVVAQGDTAPAADKPAKKEKKHTKKSTKGDAAKGEGSKEMKGAPEKTPAPAPETK
jgi:hypothetical protein